MENLYILLILIAALGYIGRRFWRITRGSGESIGGGCAACSSGTCTPAPAGETTLRTSP